MFQSLIGTIKTELVKNISFIIRKFQSLIGTIKTQERQKLLYTLVRFQSLIGTIKTLRKESQNNTDLSGFNPS